MSDTFEGLAEFERLLRKFGRDFQTAKALVTPNIEDSLEVRSAIVGFSYHAKTEAWGPNHLAYIQRHISTISSLAGPELHFSCLCIGFLLGLFQADKITEQQFRLAETQLGGFIMLNAGKLCHLSKEKCQLLAFGMTLSSLNASKVDGRRAVTRVSNCPTQTNEPHKPTIARGMPNGK